MDILKAFGIWFICAVAAIIIMCWGISVGQNKTYERCMKYFGNQGYPNSYYCKLFVGEIKARDEE